MKQDKTIFISTSVQDTIKIGEKIAKSLKKQDVVALYGNLGAGKTTLVKGIAKGLGVKSAKQISSPTYVLIHEYSAKVNVYHLDWYRLQQVVGVDEEMAFECFQNGITLVEWPERGRNLLPKKRFEVHIKPIAENQREIKFTRIGNK